jgi:cytoskeletal protein CcmA (bactofilin family)
MAQRSVHQASTSAARRDGARRPDARDDDSSVLAPGTHVRGNVRGAGSLEVSGLVEGSVAVSGDVLVPAGGKIVGRVEGASIQVSGSVDGDLRASGAIVLAAGARVVGDAVGAEVSLEEGAAFRGRIEAEFELPGALLGETPAKAPAPRGRR